MLKELTIPAGVIVKIENNSISVSKSGKTITKTFDHPSVHVKIESSKLLIETDSDSRHAKKLVNTYASHLYNLFEGLNAEYVYKLKICFSHFPVEVVVKDDEVLIKNFLGERKPRKARIIGKASVKVNDSLVTVSSSSKEAAGQTAANLESAAVVKKHDRRRFQDGIYMIEKAGKEL